MDFLDNLEKSRISHESWPYEIVVLNTSKSIGVLLVVVVGEEIVFQRI